MAKFRLNLRRVRQILMTLRRIAAYLLGWTALALFFSGQYALELWSEGRVVTIAPGMRGAALYFSSWAMLAWPLYILALRHPIQRPVFFRRLAALSVAGAGCAVTQILVRFALAQLSGWESQRSLRELIAAHLSINIVGAATLVCISQAIASERRAHAHQRSRHALELAAAQADAELSRARLQLLQQQIQPHFLFNTLNAISALIHRDAAVADRTLQQLCELLRRTLETEGVREWTLEEEVDLVERYLEIQRVRFADRLSTGISVDDCAQRLAVPPFVLQPLVENAIEHGIARRRLGGRVDIRATVHESRLILEVENDGPEFTATDTRRSLGLGLANTTSRLVQLYGAAATLQVTQRTGTAGFMAVMSIPAKAM